MRISVDLNLVIIYRTKSYAFGIFLPESKYRRAVLFLAGGSESDSQKWMSQIRSLLKPNLFPVTSDEFFVSFIDNKCSRNAGLYGTYGILSLSSSDMTIRDSNDGIIHVSWKWSQIEYAKLVIPSQNEKDTEKILILRLVSDCARKNAEDLELRLYCKSAVELQSAISRYRSAMLAFFTKSKVGHGSARQHRLMTSPLPPTPTRLLQLHGSAARRLSRSEGDLRHWSPLQHTSRAGNSSKCLPLPDDQPAEPSPLGKIAKTLISASFGLMLSTPGCSEPDTSHDYQNLSTDEDWQFVEYHDIECETDDLPELHFSFKSTISNRRESGSSITSGIYEEIDEEQSIKVDRNVQNSSEPKTDNIAPPPLPPRKSEFYNKILHRRFQKDEEKAHGRASIKSQNVVDCQMSRALSEPDYLPMSPGAFKQNSEDSYVVMKNLITHKKIIAAKPVSMS
ncbi:hypothetical protein LSTR_LSTR000154 [Laodelphax striatellus]|uniref:PH domain-containing protein n=1 Tax=Laodelphax striatellus TaxID=195883 RepID=A0A482X7P2_LAOST|nr:hypothetical protein LSTR_LSTR000154 [Laodelphax striatellus]